jgi:phosphodiesterase/alkaline phosphatase D-like protein
MKPMKKLYPFLLLLINFTAIAQNVTHGPIVGAVTDTSCRVFIRTDVAAVVTIELSSNSSFIPVTASVVVNTDASKDTVAIGALSGLTADTKYYVRAVIGEIPSGDISSFETFATPGTVMHQVFTSGSCHYDITSDDSSLYVQMASDHPKMFIQSGDWGYPDADSGTIDLYLVSPPTSYAASMDNHRTFYKRRYSCPGTYSFLHSFPVDYMYDDHDFLNDNCGKDGASGFSLDIFGTLGAPKVISQPAIARLNSIEAYQEWFPSYNIVDSTEGLYHSFRSGNVEIFVPDIRSMRTPQAAAYQKIGGVWQYAPPAGYSILGANQTAWLHNALQNSTATWKIIISTDAFNLGLRMTVDTCLKIGNGSVPYWAPQVAGFSLPNKGYTALQNYADCWAGFKEDADSLVQFVIGNNIKNVFVVSGDTHTVGLDDGTNSGLPELNCGILKKANSMEWVINQAFMGFNVWNKGGSGLCDRNNYNSAYSRIETFGDDSIRLSAIDASGIEITGWTFNVNEPYKYNPNHHINRLPVAADDAVYVNPNDTVIVAVANNDTDLENDTLYVNLKTNPAHGNATVNANNTVTYIPVNGYTGVDSFRYLICDHSNPDCQNCATALVTVSVGVSSVHEMTQDAITVFPNPANSQLFVSSAKQQNMEVELLNLLGESLLKQNMNGSGILNVAEMAAGNYLLSITNTVTHELKKLKVSIVR